MPVLKDVRKKIEVKLPETGGTVYIWSQILAGDALSNISITGENKTNISAIDILFTLIADWDFTNEVGEKLPINKENISLLPMNDFNRLMEGIQEVAQNTNISGDVKKNT